MSLPLETVINISDSLAAIQRNFERIGDSNALGLTIIKVDGEEVYHRIGVQRVEGALQLYVSDAPVLTAEEPADVVIKVDGEEVYHRIGLQRVDDVLQLYISDEPV